MAPPTEPTAVDVYRNLNDHCLSVRSRETETYGTVIAHVDRAVIDDPTFVVQPAGRERVRDEGRKNVHAFVRGTWRPTAETTPPEEAVAVTYDPYEYDSFVTRDTERAVTEARRAFVTPDGVDAVDVTFAEASALS